MQRQVHSFHLEIRTSNLFTSAPSSLWTYNYLSRIQTYHLHEKLKAPPFLSKMYHKSSFLMPSNNPENFVTGIPESNLVSTKSEFNLQGPCITNNVHAKALKLVHSRMHISRSLAHTRMKISLRTCTNHWTYRNSQGSLLSS